MAPAALPDDVVTEILIRLPQDDPSCLLRASLVCKPWLGIVSGPDFRRRLGAFHRTPPMLGLLRDYCCAHTPRFTATTASAFSLPGASGPDDCLGTALDCRHGRVLLLASNELLIIWEPMTGDLRHVPTPVAFDNIYFMPNAALVCTASGCDHRACTGGPFQIVFVFSKSNGGPMIIESETVAELCVYSSETQAWDEELTTIYIDSIVTTKRSVLVGRTLYFLFNLGYILEYDLCGHDLVVIQIPDLLLAEFKGNLMLMLVQGSGVGIAGIKESTLSVWSREASGHGDVVWEQSRLLTWTLCSQLQTIWSYLDSLNRSMSFFLGHVMASSQSSSTRSWLVKCARGVTLKCCFRLSASILQVLALSWQHTQRLDSIKGEKLQQFLRVSVILQHIQST